MSETLYRDLAARVDGEVRFDAGSRAAYAHDASNYRLPPLIRVFTIRCATDRDRRVGRV
jgi:hypothetical protein